MPSTDVYKVLGIPISITTIQDAVKTISRGAFTHGAKAVFVRDVNSLMQARDDARLHAWHEQNFLTVPDGMPLALIGRWKLGADKVGRVAGADLMAALVSSPETRQLKHYFYGGKPGIAEAAIASLRKLNPGLNVAGVYSPPMREIAEIDRFGDDLQEEVCHIAQSGADVIWVGISSPKQEYFMMRASEYLKRGVFLGVGAAFDFHANAVPRAPKWMQRWCLEWAHRLASDPKRLWKRYLISAPRFLLLVAFEQLSPSKS